MFNVVRIPHIPSVHSKLNNIEFGVGEETALPCPEALGVQSINLTTKQLIPIIWICTRARLKK